MCRLQIKLFPLIKKQKTLSKNNFEEQKTLFKLQKLSVKQYDLII